MVNSKSDTAFDLFEGRFQLERHTADRMDAAHWHEHIELNLLLSGEMTYLFNGRSERVEAGQLVLFWAAIPHQTIEVTSSSPLICIYLPLAEFLALPLPQQMKQSVLQGRFFSAADPDPLDMPMITRWAEEWQHGDDARRRLIGDEVRLRVRRMALEGPRHPTRHTQEGQPKTIAYQRVEALIELINHHHGEELSLTRLAAMAGVHASTVNRDFRSVLGLPLNEYLIRYRLARAMHLLADTEEPVLQIAYGCGFGSTSRFYELFKSRVGVTPRQFRARLTHRNLAVP